MAATLLCAAAAHTQVVPEGIHREVKGPVEMCGITALDVAGFQSAVMKTDMVEQDGGARFRLFGHDIASERMTQWAFTRPGEPAHPTATCRVLYKDSEGAWQNRRLMHCEASRAACDLLFLEFYQLDKRMAEALGEE